MNSLRLRLWKVFSEGGAGLRAQGCLSLSSWVSTCPWWSRGGGSSTASCPGLTLSPSISRWWGSQSSLLICFKGCCNLSAHCCPLQGLVIGKLGQKRVIARVVRRTVMRKLFSCQQFILGIFYLNLSSLLAVKWEIFWSEFQSRWWLNIILKILSPLIHSMYQTLLLKTQEEVSRHGGALVNYLYGAIFLGLNLQSVLWRNFKVYLEIAKNSRTIKNIAQ